MNLQNIALIGQIKAIIEASQERVIRAVDHERTLMYWHIGKYIFEEEQQGEARAEYGKQLIDYLATQLEPEFGSGFGRRQLYLFVQFYKTFPIVNALRSQLNWTQYRLLSRIEDTDKRAFYIAESTKNAWTARQMERQINSLLYERLLMSNDKESVLAVAKGEQQPSEARELIKDPMILEFLGLKRESAYYVGILLCTEKNNTLVKFSLPKGEKNIVASKYELYLPTEKQLIEAIQQDIQH